MLLNTYLNVLMKKENQIASSRKIHLEATNPQFVVSFCRHLLPRCLKFLVLSDLILSLHEVTLIKLTNESLPIKVIKGLKDIKSCLSAKIFTITAGKCHSRWHLPLKNANR